MTKTEPTPDCPHTHGLTADWADGGHCCSRCCWKAAYCWACCCNALILSWNKERLSINSPNLCFLSQLLVMKYSKKKYIYTQSTDIVQTHTHTCKWVLHILVIMNLTANFQEYCMYCHMTPKCCKTSAKIFHSIELTATSHVKFTVYSIFPAASWMGVACNYQFQMGGLNIVFSILM